MQNVFLFLLTLSFITLKNGQTYFKNLAVSQDFESMFNHVLTFSTQTVNMLQNCS